MEPYTYNLFEAITRVLKEVADAALEEEAASKVRQDLTSRLTAAKVAMQRDNAEDVVQDMASVVVALSKFVLSHKPAAEAPVKRKHLQEALKSLQRRYNENAAKTIGFTEEKAEMIREGLHPTEEYEVQHGGELREKEPPFEIDYEEAGLDPAKWLPVTDGDLIVAALPEATPEVMASEMADKILAVWNEWRHGE